MQVPNSGFDAELWKGWLTARMSEGGFSAEDVAVRSDGALSTADVERCLSATERPLMPTAVEIAKAMGVSQPEAIGAAGYRDVAATMAAISAGVRELAPLENFTVTQEEFMAMRLPDEVKQQALRAWERKALESELTMPPDPEKGGGEAGATTGDVGP